MKRRLDVLAACSQHAASTGEGRERWGARLLACGEEFFDGLKLCVFRLNRPKSAVEASFTDKLVVFAHFNNSASFDDGNRVRLAHGGKPMGHDDASSPCQKMVQSKLDLLFCCGIDAGGGFIKNQNGRIF